MKKNNAAFLILIVILFAVNNRAQTTYEVQTPPPVLKDKDFNPPEYYTIGNITGSIGNAKAVYLAKPTFPNEAKEAGAEGKIKVEIEIDEQGSVTSAKAVSGDRLFYETVQNAALKSKFLTPKINGLREIISGHLNYNFAIEKPNWFKVGYDLALIEKVPTVNFLQTTIIKKAFQQDWQTENDLVVKLKEIKDAETKRIQPVFVPEKVDVFNEKNRASQRIQARLNIPQQNPEQIFISQNLISMLRGRLGNDQINLWQLDLGVAFVKFQEVYRNPRTRRESFEIISRFVESAPNNLQPAFLEQLQNLTNSAGQKISGGDRIEIAKTIANLQKIE